jgi:hypothetical protein
MCPWIDTQDNWNAAISLPVPVLPVYTERYAEDTVSMRQNQSFKNSQGKKGLSDNFKNYR